MQIAYNLGQLSAVMDDDRTIFNPMVREYFMGNKLDNIESYLEINNEESFDDYDFFTHSLI
jgi:hypothetical protein